MATPVNNNMLSNKDAYAWGTSDKISYIVIHYVGAPKGDWSGCKSTFEGNEPNNNFSGYTPPDGLGDIPVAIAAHYCIGLDGSIHQFLPDAQIARHAKDGNGGKSSHSIGIENAQPDSTGKFTEAGRKSNIDLVCSLCKEYGLTPSNSTIKRHYDVDHTHKECPLYYVNNPSEWEKLVNDIISAWESKSFTEYSTTSGGGGLSGDGSGGDVGEAGRSNIVACAKKELEEHINTLPNKYTQWLGQINGSYSYFWCATFVSYVMNQAGISESIVPKTAAVQVLWDFAKEHNCFKEKGSGYTPQGGDVMILKSSGASHTGIVIDCDGTNFNTIEGNTGNSPGKVDSQKHSLSEAQLTGFLVPSVGAGSTSSGGSGSNYFSGQVSEDQKNQIKEANEKMLQLLEENGTPASIDEEGNMVIDYSQTLQDYMKYVNVHKIKGLQYNPNDFQYIDFKQDYVVIIRKKLYFAATMSSEENYLRMYQLNNFITANVSSNVDGSEGKCTVTLRGGERVTCVNNTDQESKDWKDWNHILNGFLNIDDEGQTDDGTKWRIGTSLYNDPLSAGIDYRTLMDAKQAKYGWKYAEKCDWEPMDEIYVFSKSRSEKNEAGQYTFKQIFFGYINSVKHNYSPSQGNLINIDASDQLKLLKYSYVNQSPSYFPGRFNQGKLDVRFDSTEFGLLKVHEPLAYGITSGMSEETQQSIITASTSTEVFFGLYPDTIIKNCCNAAGIPEKYLQTRIEPIKRVPYIFNLKQNLNFETPSFKSRLDYCKDMMTIMLMEFFSDEEGNIVFKIPNYVVGSNHLSTNNLDYEITDDIRNNIGILQTTDLTLDQIKLKCSLITPIVYTCTTNDTLQSISKKYYGDISKAIEIKYLNFSSLQYYNTTDRLEEIDLLLLTFDVNDLNARAEYRKLTSDSQISKFANQLYQKNTNTSNENGQTKLTMSMQTDMFIPEIKPEYISSFSMCDDDSGIYNSVEVNGSSFLGTYESSGGALNMVRTVPELQSIMRYGVRVMPSFSSERCPFIHDEQSAEMFGHLLLLRSQAGRYTANVVCVEDPNIKVGNPVRFMTFDENPQHETGYYDEEALPSQSVYYVNKISRSIKFDGVSTMTLDLVAGRMMGQESIFDIMWTLYMDWYTEPKDIDSVLADSIYNSTWGSLYSGSESSDSTESSSGTDYDDLSNIGYGEDPNKTAAPQGTKISEPKGTEVKAMYTAYYPANNAMEGGFKDCKGFSLQTSNQTCAAPTSVPYASLMYIKSVDGGGEEQVGRVYVVTDRGSAITIVNNVYHFDLLFSDESSSNDWGKRYGTAIIVSRSYDETKKKTSATSKSGDTNEQASSIAGSTITPPDGLGSSMSFMGWQKIHSKSSNQYKLREEVLNSKKKLFDSEGFGRIGSRYVVAMTSTYGAVGDAVDVYLANNQIIHAVIGDIKSQSDDGCNKWGHKDGNCIVEFVVNHGYMEPKYSGIPAWYNSSGNGAHAQPNEVHKEWKSTVKKVVNGGNYKTAK